MTHAAIKTYLSTIEQALRAGNATEHTHRPALEVLLNPGITLRSLVRWTHGGPQVTALETHPQAMPFLDLEAVVPPQIGPPEKVIPGSGSTKRRPA